jgi:hypothetical protein
MRLHPRQARARVAAKLDRHPRDVLEARVVLEAWGGVRPEVAHDIARGVVVSTDDAAHRPEPYARGAAREPGTSPARVQTLLLMCAVLATSAWAAHTVVVAGAAVAGVAWHVALPTSLGIQWVVSRRHLALPGLSGLRADSASLPVITALPLGLAAVTAWRPSYAVVMALVAAWVVVPLLVRRGWWHVGGLVLGASAAASHWLPAAPVVTATAGVLLLVLALAVATSPVPQRRLPSWAVTVPAAIGAALAGLLLILGLGRSWQTGSAAAVLALAPALAGGGVASLRLAEIWHAVPRALARVEILEADAVVRARRAARRAVMVVLGKAAASLAAVTALGSIAVLVMLPPAHAIDVRPALAVFAGFSVVMVLVVAVEALVRGWSALLVIGAADLAAVGATAADVDSVMTVAAVAAGAVAVVLLAAPVRAPDRAFAAVL